MRRLLLTPLLRLAGCRAPTSPITFAPVADVQHADNPDAGARRYRLALEHLDGLGRMRGGPGGS